GLSCASSARPNRSTRPFTSCGPSGRYPASRYGWVVPPTLLCLGHLVEGQLDRRLPVEDVDQDLQLRLLDVDLRDGAGEVGEGSGDDPDHVALLPLQPEGRLDLGLLLDGQDLLDLPPGERGRLGTCSARDEPVHARC